MLDNIIGNDKAKFMKNYSKLSNELHDFLSKDQKANGGRMENKSITPNKKFNVSVKENKVNFQETKDKFNCILSKEKNILDKNIFSDDIIKKEKWEHLKKTINLTKNNNINSENSNSVFDRIKNNLNKMKKEFTLEEAFQKNLENLNNLNIISPRNNIINNLGSKSNRNNEKLNNGIVKDAVLVNNLNNSNKINSNLKYKFNQYLNKQNDFEFYFNNDLNDKTQERKCITNLSELSINQKSVRNRIIDFFYDEPMNNDNKKDNKNTIRTESAFYKNIIRSSPSNKPYNENTVFKKNTIFHKNRNNRNNNLLDNSDDKINNILNNYYEERKKNRNENNSISKNAEMIQRFRNRLEKGSNLIPIEKEFKSFNFSKKNFETNRPRTSILDNWNKFEKKVIDTKREIINSDILRLELINLNCYSNNEIEQIKGIEKLKEKNKKRRASSIDQL